MLWQQKGVLDQMQMLDLLMKARTTFSI